MDKTHASQPEVALFDICARSLDGISIPVDDVLRQVRQKPWVSAHDPSKLGKPSAINSQDPPLALLPRKQPHLQTNPYHSSSSFLSPFVPVQDPPSVPSRHYHHLLHRIPSLFSYPTPSHVRNDELVSSWPVVLPRKRRTKWTKPMKEGKEKCSFVSFVLGSFRYYLPRCDWSSTSQVVVEAEGEVHSPTEGIECSRRRSAHLLPCSPPRVHPNPIPKSIPC